MWTTKKHRLKDRPIKWADVIRDDRLRKRMSTQEYADWLDVEHIRLLFWESGLFKPCRMGKALLIRKGVL